MSSSTINTARLNDVTGLDHLSATQLEAVRKLRKRANIEKVAPYTLACFASRSNHWERFSDAKRFSKLTPYTRERLIADFREDLHPWEPTVVAVWSAWCDQNGIDPWAYDPGQAASGDHVGSAVMSGLMPVVEEKPNGKRGYDKGATQRAETYLRAILGDGQEHLSASVRASSPVKSTVLLRTAQKIGVNIRREYLAIKHGGSVSYWSLPGDFTAAEGRDLGAWGKSKRTRSPESFSHTIRTTLDDEFIKMPRIMLNTEAKKLAAEKRARKLRRIARRAETSPITLTRWAEMTQYNGKREGIMLVDRESDEGIELAEEVFTCCMPWSPQAISSISYRMSKEGR